MTQEFWRGAVVKRVAERGVGMSDGFRARVRQVAHMTALAFVMSLVVAREAWAYIDFGSGSLLLQLILASFLGALYAIRAQLRRLRDRIVGFFGRTRRPNP